jgi:ABC-type Fe3+ transport system substrate-binding protein
VVISPHIESIRAEFGRGFSAWHLSRYGKPAEVEWRDLGGTSDALRFVQSEFANKPDGIAIDCFFGGGPEPYLLLSDKKLTQPCELPEEVLQGMPQQVNGMEVYDAKFAWYGAALSSFGILQSTRVQRVLHLPEVRRWEELANPRLRGWVGAGDPRNSGTMNNMYEAFLQAYGWERGWNLLGRISGNVSKFDRLSSSTAKEVTLGETAYAFAIDFYGFSQIAVAGRTNMVFVLPEDFTAVSPDGIAILRGAPHPIAAQRFLEFVIGEPGQKLWFLPKGHPEGPQQFSIERMAVRPDFYRRFKDVSNIQFSPFEIKQPFAYNAKVARARREIVAALFGALFVDTHSELRNAWQAVIRRKMNPADVAAIGRVPVTEAEALQLVNGPWKEAAFRNRQKIEWQSWAQSHYRSLANSPASAIP